MVILHPIFLFICFSQILIYGRNIFFVQERSGLNEKSFKIIKFRTMKNLRDTSNKLLPDTKRLTKFGKLLRYLSLDELPNLINIVRGEMSLVGPRPLPISYVAKMSELQRKRFKVRPGLTGLAQISGRNNLEWADKLRLDLLYVDKISFILDMKIILSTFREIIGNNELKDLDSISTEDYTPEF
jgi:lipopolysaccharide/colanic/teichoic acid biosynthesis glycosyltransferase